VIEDTRSDQQEQH
jgi:hypothetical protein